MRTIYYLDPTSINHVMINPINDMMHEHPFEYMAYDLQNKICK